MAYIGQDLGLGQAERFIFTASGAETVVSADDDGRVIGYTAGQVSVYLNGDYCFCSRCSEDEAFCLPKS